MKTRTFRFLSDALLTLAALLAGKNAWAQDPATIGSIQYNESLGAYEINCAQHLRDLSAYLYETIDEPLSKKHDCDGLTFKMTADIDFAPTSAWNDYDSDEHNFTAIGFQTEYGLSSFSAFKGTFDGQGHTISGIRNNNGTIEQALFGYVYGGTVKNVTLANTRIRGWCKSGGIVGMNDGTVQNCHVGSDVAIRVTRSGASCISGVVGDNSGTVTGCTSAAVIVKTSVAECSAFGGVVGLNNGTISDCKAEGVIVSEVDNSGAVVGLNNGTISGNTYHSSMVVGDAITTYAFNIGTGAGDVSGATLVTNKLFLYDNRSNTKLTEAYAKPYGHNNSSTAHGATYPNVRLVDLTLKGRSFYKDGTWNTLALPFNVSTLSGTPLSEATIMTLDEDNTAYDSGTGVLTVAFKSVGSISQKTPYIVKWTSGSDITDPTFSNVDVPSFSSYTQTATAGLVKFISNFAPLSSTDGRLFDVHNADNRGYHSYMTISAPDAPEGSTFSGWFTDEAFTTPVTNIIPFGPDGTFTLYTRLSSQTIDLTAHSAEYAGQTHYWTTFYDNAGNYRLPAGAQAFTLGADKALYRVGDGSIIPAGCAVVIIAEDSSLTLTLTQDTAAPEEGNILRGVGADTAKTSLITGSQKLYVLGLSGSTFGFFEYSGTTVPANKAYYVE